MSDILRRAPALVALYAVLLAYAAVTLMPFAWMLITSFKESRDVFRLPPSFVPTMLYGPEPFANYTEVLTRYDFLLYFRNSFFVSTMAALGQVATCALAGYAFARMELPGKTVIFALILATVFFGERPDATVFLGAAIIVGAGVYIFLRERAVARRERYAP